MKTADLIGALPVPIGIYDNPATMRREVYGFDGSLQRSWSASMVEQKTTIADYEPKPWGAYPPPHPA